MPVPVPPGSTEKPRKRQQHSEAHEQSNSVFQNGNDICKALLSQSPDALKNCLCLSGPMHMSHWHVAKLYWISETSLLFTLMSFPSHRTTLAFYSLRTGSPDLQEPRSSSRYGISPLKCARTIRCSSSYTYIFVSEQPIVSIVVDCHPRCLIVAALTTFHISIIWRSNNSTADHLNIYETTERSSWRRTSWLDSCDSETIQRDGRICGWTREALNNGRFWLGNEGESLKYIYYILSFLKLPPSVSSKIIHNEASRGIVKRKPRFLR